MVCAECKRWKRQWKTMKLKLYFLATNFWRWISMKWVGKPLYKFPMYDTSGEQTWIKISAKMKMGRRTLGGHWRLPGHCWTLIVLLSVVSLLPLGQCLRIEDITFPNYVMKGQSVTMICDYSLGEGEYVDSIKWYKDDNEFYRMYPNSPSEKHKVMTFPRKGVRLDKEKTGVSLLKMIKQWDNECIFI